MIAPGGDWVAVARVGKPHALGGALFLTPYTRTVDDFLDAPLSRVYIRERGAVSRELTFSSLAAHLGRPLATFEGVDDRTAAEALVGLELVIPAEERWPLPEGRYYLDELLGLRVIEDATGRDFGALGSVMDGASYDLFVFPHPDKPGKEVYLPNTKEFVLAIEKGEGRIRVRIPDGLLDL